MISELLCIIHKWVNQKHTTNYISEIPKNVKFIHIEKS